MSIKNDVHVKNGITIPETELEITTSRAGGPGGQHVNKTDSRITVRFNVTTSTVLSDAQKERVRQNLGSRITADGDLIIHHSTSRSQQQNKKNALEQLAHDLRKALHVPKKRIATKVSKSATEKRLQKKTQRSTVKKLRSKKIED